MINIDFEFLINLINLTLLFIIIAALKSTKTFFDEKARNAATKQDVREITEKTEEIRDHFEKSKELFQTDLHFKYNYFEKQYNELYIDLYCYICQSEARRKMASEFKNIIHNFEDVPIFDYEIVTVNEANKFEVEKILDLIKSKYKFASPDLIKIYNLYQSLKDWKEDSEVDEKIEVNEVRLKKKLIVTIISDFNNLRKYLQLNVQENEVASLKQGNFMEF